MEVILQQDFPALGYVGDRVSVRRGFARNFLVPRGIAVEIGSRSARELAHRVSGINAHKAKLKLQAQELGQQLSALALEFVLKLGGQGKTFGSISVHDIEVALKEKGFTLDRRQIRLPEQIKSGGEFQALVKLHSEVTINLPLKVTVERVAAPETGEGAAERKKGKRKGRGRAEEQTEGASEASDAAAETADKQD